MANRALSMPEFDRFNASVSDRRITHRGGRRASDGESSSPPAVTPCASCDAGTAGLFTSVTEGTRSLVTYVCRNCGHQFDRIW
jgi:hypothetical protein